MMETKLKRVNKLALVEFVEQTLYFMYMILDWDIFGGY
jgi:hypothetical protein